MRLFTALDRRSVLPCRWRALTCEAGQLSADDISWPPDQNEILRATARLILGNQPGAPEMHEQSYQAICMNKDVVAAYKAAFRRLSLRWHPDKFQSKCGSQISREQQAALVERVSVIFQCVSTQWQQHVSHGHAYMLYSLQHLQSFDFMGNLTCGSMYQTVLQLQNLQSCSCPTFPLAGDQPDCSYKKAQ